MPIAVFRRHQKKLLAIFGILAMIAFILPSGMTGFGNNNAARNGNRVVVDLYGKPVYRSDLELIGRQRSIANQFFAAAVGDPSFFGGYTTRDLVDAMILSHEADRLGIPASSDFGRDWLSNVWPRLHPGTQMNKSLFQGLLRRVGSDTGGEQVLASLASQVRLFQARGLLGQPMVTPLDVFQAYREQNERSTYRVVSFPVANFLDKTGEPTSADIESLYEKYKDVLPDPNRDTPGFKVPRQVKLEVVSIDGNAVAKGIQAKLTEDELKSYYESRRESFARSNELPTAIFKDDEDPKTTLTPVQYLPFAEVKDSLAESLSREKAQEQIIDKLGKFGEEYIDKFGDAYQDAILENADAKKSGQAERVGVPKPTSLAEVAKANGLEHEVTPLLSKDEATGYGKLGNATLGLVQHQGAGDVKFADAIFAPKSPLYDGMEFNEPEGRRYLARKLEDIEPHVAPLAEVRPDVVAAWKMDKARGLADKAAKDLAETIKKDGGKIKEQIVAGRPVIVIDNVTKLEPGMQIMSRSQYLPPTPAELRLIPKASDSLREALFGLKPNEVAVEADVPKQTYYVMTLDHRDPASFSGLYGIIGMPLPYQEDAFRKAYTADEINRMTQLRASAGLKADWAPNDEKERTDNQDAG